jgi:glycosyltransferase involved in cell wall biosynthesis
MKILHVANELVDTGNGIVNSAVDLACTQSIAGHDVSFISSGGGHVSLLAKHKVRHHEASLYPNRPFQLVRGLPRLRSLVRREQPEIVHAHMMTNAVLMRLGRTFAGFGNYGLVTTIHNEWRLTSHLMRAGDRVIVLSDHGKKTFRDRGFPDHKLRIVPHGILHSPRRLHEIEDEKVTPPLHYPSPLIVTMGGLYRRKGIGDLIAAFGQIADEFPQASVCVLGWGPDRASFERQKKTVKGGERIHLPGFVAKPRSILRTATVFVLASHTESFPLSLAEAREAGCAVVGTTVGGVPELLERAGRAVGSTA